MATVTQDFDSFAAQWRAAGFDEVVERKWPPSKVLDSHQHPFSVHALVVQGEMWLRCGDDTKHLLPGDTFELARDVVHDERYGPEGATYWVARRNA